MSVRQPVVAGAFYQGHPDRCRGEARQLIEAAQLPAGLPEGLVGGIVPHAGWAFSGAIAARTLKAVVGAGRAGTVVLFGADHCGTVRMGEVYDCGAWRTPLGDVPVDEELAAAVLAAADCCRPNPSAHGREHSLEVQLPILQALAPEARILPIAVPPTEAAVEVGRAVGDVLSGREGACVVGSTDLTHYGSRYGFAPAGSGPAGEKWARENDRRIIERMEAMDAEGILAEARQRHNACGAGAAAATVAACRRLGATRGICLAYDNSYRIVHEKYPWDLDDSTVGYAAVVFA